MKGQYESLVTTLLLAILLVLGESLYIIIDILLKGSNNDDSKFLAHVTERRVSGEKGFANSLPVFEESIDEMKRSFSDE